MATNKHPNTPQSSDYSESSIKRSNANTADNPCECPESNPSSTLWQFLIQLLTVIGIIIKILEFFGIEL